MVATVVGIGFLMACSWALLCPMFLAPDEDNHYDYALTVATLHRGLNANETHVARDTHPVVAYLLAATSAREQKLDPAVHARNGYGTLRYFAALDAGAPKVDGSFGARSERPVPYIGRIYPIGYYALVAVAIEFAASITHGSAVAEFFSARLISCLLLVPTSVFAWLALREIGVPRRRSLVLLTCTSLFPLTTWTFGSVQPDTLAAALTAAIAYVALRLRRARDGRGPFVVLALLFAALAATKFQYYLADVVAVGAMFLTRLPREHKASSVAAWFGVSVVAPAFAIVATLPMLRTAVPVVGLCGGVPTIGNAHSASQVVGFVRAGLLTIVNDGLRNGNGLRSFWLAYSAYRNRTLIVIDDSVTAALLGLIPVATSLMALLFVAALVRSTVRLLRIARLRSWSTAARVASGNVLVNAYLTFFLVFTAYEIDIGGFMPVQGRYWIPYMPAIFLVATSMVPRAFGKYRRAVGDRVALLLVAFALMGSAFNLPNLYRDFYSPSGEARDTRDEHLVSIGARVGDGRHDVVVVEGVAADLRTASNLNDFAIVLDRRRQVSFVRTFRADMMCEFESTLGESGFRAKIDRKTLRRGVHELQIVSTNARVRKDERVEATTTFTI